MHDHRLVIVTAQADPTTFNMILNDSSFREIESHPQTGAYGRAYYPAVHGDNYIDLSFAVCWENAPVLVGLFSLIDKTLGLHGLPGRIVVRENVSSDLYRTAIRAMHTHLDEIVSSKGIREILIRERAGSGLSPIGEAVLSREAQTSVNLIGYVDLTIGPTEWRRALRKSFRSLVNWGRENLHISYVNAVDSNYDRFDRYRMFHAEIAGRITRPQASWDVMYTWLTKGHGELICGEFEGKLAAAALFIDGTETCIYMSAAYNRSLKKPLGHFMVWHGIERAQQRGMTNLELGDVHMKDAADEKNYSIGYFKRGFATQIDTYLVWRYASPAGATANEES